MAPLVSLAPAQVVQRVGYLRRVVAADPAPPALSPGARAGVVAGDGATLIRPETPGIAVPAGIRSGGRDVTQFLEIGGISLRRHLSEPWTASYQLRLDTTPTDDPLTTEDGRRLLTEDGREVVLEGHDPGMPGLLELVRMSAPTATYRDTVLALDPVVYWSMDSADRKHLEDYSEAGVNHGSLNLDSALTRVDPAVPYGGAVEMALPTVSVEGPRLPNEAASAGRPEQRTVMLWIKGAGGGRFMDAGGLRLWRNTDRIGVAGCGNLGPIDPDAWTHVAAVRNGTSCSLYVNGGELVRHDTYRSGSFGTRLIEMRGPLTVDEVSFHERALTAGEIAGAYAARDGVRTFQGIVKQMDIAGRGASSERIVLDCSAVGLDEAFKVNRARKEFETDGTETVREIVQRLLDDELPGYPISADGLDVDELVAPFRENLDTVHRAITRLQQLHHFVWHLDPMGEIVGHRRSEAPSAGLTLDETVNVEQQPPPMTVDARLFRSQQTLAAAGGRPEVDVFESDGRKRLFELTHQVDWGQSITIEVDGVAQSVDATGQFVFQAAFAADQGTNSILIPGSASIPAVGAEIVVRYRSRRTQAVSVADIEAIRKYGLRSDVVFDPSPNDYTRREALAAAVLAANATPTRRIDLRGRTGRIPLPTPGLTYIVNARAAYGVSGGEPWMLSAAHLQADPRFRADCILSLQQGPYQPLSADFYDRIAAADAKLIPDD